jgi:DNA-binding transcriptional MerR regulator/methylmalonyl-CoA mutase cobalamin-binding subunit
MARAARQPATQQPLKWISEVERDTGVPRATLRIWERRYGFPAPVRDGRGERCYPEEQVAQLRAMQRLIAQGHRPGQLIAAGAAEIRRLSEAAAPVAARRPRSAPPLLRLLREHDAVALQEALDAMLARDGLAHFAAVEVPALNAMIGDAWRAGELEIHEEHLYSDCLYQVLRPAIFALQTALRPEAPQVLLTTFPDEPHGLGLLMAEALFALQGCPTVSLGMRLPVAQIAAAARAYRADLVGLTFTASLNPAHVLRGLQELRGMLPVAIRIWAGGHCPVLYRKAIPGVRAVRDVAAIPSLLAEDFALPPRASAR